MSANSLFNVLRAYSTLQHPHSIVQPEVSFHVMHEFLLGHILLNPHFQEYPPSQQYQLLFWKWAINCLESMSCEEDELDERIYTRQIELLHGLPSSKNSVGLVRPTTSYLTYLWPSEKLPQAPIYPGYASVTIVESRTTIEGGTTGLRTWSASLVLAQYIINYPELLDGQRVLELGCGVGFLGAIAAFTQLHGSCETQSLWLTDLNESVLQRCEVNIRLPCNASHAHPDLNVQALDWSDALDPDRRPLVRALLEQTVRPTVVLGADLVYEPSIIPLLISVLSATLSPGEGRLEPTAYIALTLRNGDTFSEFLRQARMQLVVEELTAVPVIDNVFTQAAELGQDASQQIVKILKIKHM